MPRPKRIEEEGLRRIVLRRKTPLEGMEYVYTDKYSNASPTKYKARVIVADWEKDCHGQRYVRFQSLVDNRFRVADTYREGDVLTTYIGDRIFPDYDPTSFLYEEDPVAFLYEWKREAEEEEEERLLNKSNGRKKQKKGEELVIKKKKKKVRRGRS